MNETERILVETLTEAFLACPVCFALIHKDGKEQHWAFHRLSASQMAYGMYVVQIDNLMKAQGVTWPGDLKEVGATTDATSD